MPGAVIYTMSSSLLVLGLAGFGKALSDAPVDIVNGDGKLLMSFATAATSILFIAGAVWMASKQKAKSDRQTRQIRSLNRRFKASEECRAEFQDEMREAMFAIKLKLGIDSAVRRDREHRKEGSVGQQ